jgi:natural product precursor
MKTKRFEKMKLKKITIANLNTQEMRMVLGGDDSCDTTTVDACFTNRGDSHCGPLPEIGSVV